MHLFPTTVIGSYSVPEWLERAKNEYQHQRIGKAYLTEMVDVAIKAAIKDQERAGVDIVSDGELRRDNDVDYFLERVPGVEIAHLGKTHYYEYHEARVTHRLPSGDETASLGLVDDYRFTCAQTDLPIKFSFTGPFSLAKRLRRDPAVTEEEVVLGLARILNREARALVAAGARFLQLDEPFLAGYPEQTPLAVRALNTVVDGVDANWTAHICYGNRHARPSWEGHYDFLFPAILEARISTLALEFARKGYDDLALFAKHRPPFGIGLGVIDVKSREVESAEAVAASIERALDALPPERIVVNPDCGLRHLPIGVAFAKLRAMTAGAAIVRARLGGAAGPGAPQVQTVSA